MRRAAESGREKGRAAAIGELIASSAKPISASYGPADVPYMRTFFNYLAPASLDHAALLSGFEPPERSGGFTWCELGCGQGVTPVILAASHPRGQFFGIDAMPAHIGHAKGLAREADIRNVSFHAVDFARARRGGFPAFDYIVAHGVYGWVDSDAQADLLRFIDRHLKPGGIVYLSYNAMPGRLPDLPMQRLLVEFGTRLKGDSAARVSAAARHVHRLAKANVQALRGSRAVGLTSLPSSYLAHEYLVTRWRPAYVTEVRAWAAKISLVPVGCARFVENYDKFVLSEAARKELRRIRDDDLRELARDFFINRPFRADLFTRGAKRLDDKTRVQRLLTSTFSLTRPAAAVRFQKDTPSGHLKFDNDASRHVVATLARGPCRLSDVEPGLASRRDLLANALTLCAAEEICPVEPGNADVTRLSEAIYRRLGGPDELLYLPLPCGTALSVNRGLLRRLRDRRSLREYPGWQEFLAAQHYPSGPEAVRGSR